MSREDLQVSLALYVLYPALLWLFLNVFHGVCGIEAYKQKKEGVEACKRLWHMAQTRAVSGSRQGQGDNAREADAEFQEFLANFTDEDPGW
eukprot:scaffold4329_cov115-Cylindrotheca_fusiformis.AAC.6